MCASITKTVIATMACYSSLAFLFLCLCCISFPEALGFSVELIHHNSPRSPFYNPIETHSQKVANTFHNPINRIRHPNQAFSPKNTPHSDVIHFSTEYLMTFSVGTPPIKVFGYVDTTSDLIWLQCNPCKNCGFNPTAPVFDTSKSTTYKTIPCTSDTCHSVSNTSCSSSDDQEICKYNDLLYGRVASSGDLSLETLNFDSNSGSPISFPKTVFGCGHNNPYLLPFGPNTGRVGLGNGPTSLISQMGPSISGRFSYCFVPEMISVSTNTSGKIHFGDDAVISGDGTVSTPMVKKGYYLLTLEGFSVGDNKIDFGNSSSGGDSEGGNIIIDSFQPWTLLPNDLLTRLESAISSVVKLEPVKVLPGSNLRLCYKGTLNEKLEVPVITAHFRGADIQLNALNSFMQVEKEIVCLAFTSVVKPQAPFPIFGNTAQHNFLVGYDLQKNIVSFKPMDCSKQ